MIKVLKSLNAGNNATCQACREDNPDIANALGPWFSCAPGSHGNCIAFVGKIARGDDLGALVSDKLEDVEPFGASFIKKSTWPYWTYTRAIMMEVFGSLDSALLHTSFTNLIKCNNSTTSDTSSKSQKDRCLRENQFVLKELEVVSPKAVVFYAGTGYDEYIRTIQPRTAVRYVDEVNTKILIGKKQMPWWSRKYFAADETVLTSFLRIGHPERMKKVPYVKEVSGWIKESLFLHEPNTAINWTP